MGSKVLNQSPHSASSIYPGGKDIEGITHTEEILTRRHAALESGQAGPCDRDLSRG